MKNKKIKNNKTRGFTLVELMVSTSIFAIIMLASIGSLFTLLGASRNSRATQTALDNVNFALESMTRSIRMGSNYICTTSGTIPLFIDVSVLGGRDCTGGGTAISFLPQSEGQNLTIYKITCPNNSIDFCTLERGISGKFVQVVSDAVNIKELNFFVNGTTNSVPKKQPSVFIKLKGEVKVKNETVPFNIQTFITQRNY